MPRRSPNTDAKQEPSKLTVFTLEEVNALVPRLNMIVGEQMLRREEIDTFVKELREKEGSLPDTLVPKAGDSPGLAKLKLELAARIEDWEKGWHAIDDIGGVLKDPRTGLVDFYGRVDGSLVWLCWKYPETEIRHYHALDEGFSGRKEIKGSIRTRMIN